MDITKYKSIAVNHDTYTKIADLQKTIAPLSRSKMVSHLVEKVWQKHHQEGTLKLSNTYEDNFKKFVSDEPKASEQKNFLKEVKSIWQLIRG